ncbi:MAG TPA: cupin domain-containing protein [Actinomycetota bacterium]|nr:cupin domain-containing protein [Actinomycetota bacterium]
MDIHPSDEVRSVAGGGHFTGRVWLDGLIDEPGDEGMRMYRVCFEPGARTNWHQHPGGQALYILAGQARVGAGGEAARTVSPGDSVYTPPGQWHWHGATPGAYMVHVAVNPGGKTEWGDDRPVTDEEYEG